MAACLWPVASASARPAPKLLQGSYVANYFIPRPGLMSFYSPVARTFTSYITGPGVTRAQYRRGRDGQISWTTWNRHSAIGRGKQWEDSCTPSCVPGTWEPTPVTLRASRVRDGRFTRLAITLHPRFLRPLTFRYRLLRTRRRFGGVRIYYWGTRTTVADLRRAR